MAAKTYDPSKVILTLAGNPMSGFAPDTFISIEFSSDLFEMSTGADGEVARAKLLDKSAIATLTLQSTSTQNAVVSALAAADEQFTFSFKDGLNVAFSANAWIKKNPTIERGIEVPTHEWEIQLASVIPFLGGNP